MEVSPIMKDEGYWPGHSYKQQECKLAHVNKCWCAVVILLVIFSSCQFCWSVHLNIELSELRGDVDALLELAGSRVRPDSFDLEESEENDYQNFPNGDSSPAEDMLFNPQSSLVELDDEDLLASSQHAAHSIAKRSARQGSRGKKGKGKGSRQNNKNIYWKKHIRKHKAIAIHVKAEPDVSRPQHGITAPGPSDSIRQTLKNWHDVSEEYKGFDSSKLKSDGYITVCTSGFYYVYSQVIFQTTDLPYMVAEIGVKAMGGTTFTKCQFSRENNATIDSYIACHSNGVVFLRQGEGISLVVNPQQVKVFMEPAYTYFGAFFVGF